MAFDLVQLLVLLAAVTGSSVMVGVGVSLFQRIRRLEAGARDVDRLVDEVDALREQLTAAREEVAEIGERVDFTERLLSSGRREDREPS